MGALSGLKHVVHRTVFIKTIQKRLNKSLTTRIKAYTRKCKGKAIDDGIII